MVTFFDHMLAWYVDQPAPPEDPPPPPDPPAPDESWRALAYEPDRKSEPRPSRRPSPPPVPVHMSRWSNGGSGCLRNY